MVADGMAAYAHSAKRSGPPSNTPKSRLIPCGWQTGRQSRNRPVNAEFAIPARLPPLTWLMDSETPPTPAIAVVVPPETADETADAAKRQEISERVRAKLAERGIAPLTGRVVASR